MRRLATRNFIMSIVPFVLACAPQAFTAERCLANWELVHFECQFDQVSKHVSISDVSKKTSQGLETGNFLLVTQKEI